MITFDQEKKLQEEVKHRKAEANLFKKLILYSSFAVLMNLPMLLASHFHSDFRWFPDTWKCKACEYENYEGIGTCAVCGTKKR